MDTFESRSERKESRLGHQSGYNAGQQSSSRAEPAAEPHKMRENQQGARIARYQSRAARAASDAGEMKQIQRKAARIDKVQKV